MARPRQRGEKSPDEVLRRALENAYTARSKLFYAKIGEQNLDKLLDEVASASTDDLQWDPERLAISRTALQRIGDLKIPLHHVFCHPSILDRKPALLRYYRNLAALSQKGLSQLRTGGAESREERDLCVTRTLNSILSKVVEELPSFSLDAGRDVMLAEIGTEVQGSWVNLIGSGAARKVQKMFEDFAIQHKISVRVDETVVRSGRKKRRQKSILLVNGWRLVFAAEPDVGVYDPSGILKAAIEIKGSMDRAGAQTRYGEAKKSFAKALRENPRCETIYLASVFTKAVVNQIRDDGQVRKTFNLIDVFDNTERRKDLLDEIFKFIIRLDY